MKEFWTNCDPAIAKIISNGQSGAARGAIAAAKEAGVPYGGMIPKGRFSDDGIVPIEFDQMRVAVRKDIEFSTEWNIVHSNATLIVARSDPHASDPSGLTGELLRIQRLAEARGKPYLVLFRSNAYGVFAWLCSIRARGVFPETGCVLNVVGPTEAVRGIGERVRQFVGRLLAVDSLRQDAEKRAQGASAALA